ncbi:ABC transporter transmembrane domain-containing protein [Paenibacillus alkalitolerans]|uniref:ABC transporter transmembrane domain-containing protein n=1 Tax=Paenibacillus alkalitolerans TaxID=2799335 RepID=UPI0018F4EA18|nr:ABC transporter ATP-binding protein [Paenibacillus alkalitolerans]
MSGTEQQSKRPISHVLLRLIKLGKPYIGWYIVLCILTAGLSLVGVGIAESLRRIINAATQKDLSLLVSAAVLALGIVILEVVANLLKARVTAMLEFKSTARLQTVVLGKLMRIRMKEADRYHSADLISRINDSAAAAQAGVNAKAMDFLGNMLQIVFMITYLVTLQFSLTFGTLLIAALTPLVMLPFAGKLRGLYEQRQKIQAEQQSFTQDIVQGAEVVRSFSLAAKLRDAFAQKCTAYLKTHYRVLRLEAVGYRLPILVVNGGLLYVLGYGGYLVIQGRLDVGAVAAFLISFERIANPVSSLANLWTELQASLAQANRMFEVLDSARRKCFRRDRFRSSRVPLRHHRTGQRLLPLQYRG